MSNSVSTSIYDLPIEIVADILQDVEYEKAKVIVGDSILRQRFLHSCKNFMRNFVVFKNYNHTRLSLHDIYIAYNRLQDPNDKIFWICNHSDCFSDEEDVIRDLLSEPGVEPWAMDQFHILRACKNGDLKVVKRLLSTDRMIRTLRWRYETIRLAYKNAHMEVVELLISDSILAVSYDFADIIDYAAGEGLIELVKILLAAALLEMDFIGAKFYDLPCRNRRGEVIKLLLSDKRVTLSYFLEPIFKNGCGEILKLLLSHERVLSRDGSEEEWENFAEDWEHFEEELFQRMESAFKRGHVPKV
jgi:ankyrin repeat protein